MRLVATGRARHLSLHDDSTAPPYPVTALLDGPRLAPASGGSPRQIVVLLHGYGSNGADLISLAPSWRQGLPDALFIAPNAPERCVGSPGGYQWWGLASFDRAAPALDAFLDAQLAAHELTADRLLLVGFSQGTMMALHAGPRRAEALAGIVGYSGMMPDPVLRAEEVRSRPPVLLIHGAADTVVPVAGLHEADRELRRLGFDVATHVSPGLGHSLDAEGAARGAAFAKAVLTAA